MARSLGSLTIDLLLKTGNLETDAGRAARVLEKNAKKISADFANTSKSVRRDSENIQRSLTKNAAGGANDASRSFQQLAMRAIGVGAAIAGVRAAIGRGDEWTNLNNRLKLVTSTQAQFVAAQSDVIRIASTARQSIGATAELYQRIAMNQDALGLSGTQLARVVETISKTMVISGASASAAQAALMQLGQAFASGVLRGEELNSVMEQAPALAQAIAAGMGKTVGQLRELGKAGELTAQSVISALQSQAGAVDESFGKMASTVGQAMTEASNNMLVMIGRASEATGATQALAASIQLIGNNLPAVISAMGAFASVKFTEAVIGRVKAMNVSLVAERANAAQIVVSARALEQRTAMMVVDSALQMRAAGTARARLTAEAQLTAAVRQHAAATGQLAAAQAAAAVAGQGAMARAGSALLGVFGGPVGLAVTIAATAAGWLLFRDNTNAASRAVDGMTGALADQIEQFKALDQLQKAGVIVELKEQISDSADDVRDEVGRMVRDVQGLLAQGFTKGSGAAFDLFTPEARDAAKQYADQVKRLADEYDAGKISASKFSDGLSEQNQQLMGNQDAARYLRDRLAEQGAEVGAASTKHQELTDKLAAVEGRMTAAQIAARDLAGGLADLGNAANIDFSSVDKMLASMLETSSNRYAEAMLGKSGAARQRFEQLLLKEGINPASDEARASRAQLMGILAMDSATDAANEAKKKPKKDNTASKAAADAARDYAKSLEEAARAAAELTSAQDTANRTLEDWRAELSGPAATAMLKYSRMERELDLDLAAGILTLDAYAESMGLVAQMREKDVDLMSDQAKAAEAMAEDQKRTAEEYQYNWEGAISSVAGAMGDFFADGLRDGKSFVDELKNIFKRWLSNVIAIFSDGALKRAFGSVAQSVSGWMSSMGGSGGNSGGIVNTAMKFFTGGSGGNGGFSMAGVSGSTGSTWTSMITTAASSWLGLGGSATGAGAMATFGSEIGAFSTAGGTSALGAGGAASGAAAMATAIPIIGAIIVGMMMNDAAFKEGFKLDGQKNDMSEYYAKKGMFAVTIATATVGAADTLLRSIGLSDRWASLISGSSLHAKIWGMGTPKVNASGIQGSVGFGGIEGESFADIKQKGGWFRSDKNWTETGALSAGIDRAFDMASARVGSGAMDLAKQLGIDVTGALGAVRIDIGKLVLDADPEKAREQIEAKITEVMESLSTAAIKALGFNRLLDDGFASSDIMSTLAVSIALVTGGAEKLGRALSDLEKENVARATEYFEGLAIKNGTGLGDEVQRTVGLLGEYSSLITGVDTELQTRDLNQYQSAQLQIELQYRNQIKSANQLAKALGLTGARAEDLAKIEQLRAVNMASLQTAMEAQKNTFLDDLGLSDLSTLRDDQKLTESMQLLRDAVGSGDLQRAQQLSQQALGFGRNLYASGNDYSGLYGEVTGLLDSIAPAGMDGFDAAGLDTIADLLTGLPDGIASAMFNLLYGPAVADTSVLPPPPIAPPPPNGLTPGRPGGRDLTPGDGTNVMLQAIVDRLDSINGNTGGSLQQQRSDSLAMLNR